MPTHTLSPSRFSFSLWLPVSETLFWLGETAYYAPRGANCPVAHFRFPTHSLGPLPSPLLPSLSVSFAKSSGVHAEPRALDPSEVPGGRKVTPSWTPTETAHTSLWQAGGEGGRFTLTER